MDAPPEWARFRPMDWIPDAKAEVHWTEVSFQKDTMEVPKMREPLRGWITGVLDETSRTRLETLGITIGKSVTVDRGVVTFEECVVSDAAFEKLEPLWGTYIWGLQ